MNTNDSGGLAILGIPLIVIILIWLGTAVVAGAVAPADRRNTFFLVTLLLLGPVGIALALIANPREPITYVQLAPRPLAAGRVRYYCPRCGADVDLLPSAAGYVCWRCSAEIDFEPTPPSPSTPPLPSTSSPPPRSPAPPSIFSKDYWSARFPGLDFRPPWETGPPSD